MVGYWISFAAIFITIPIGVIEWKRLTIDNKKISLEQEKKVNSRLLFLVLFYWLCDLFYMSCFTNNMTLQYIFGVIIMLIVLMNVYKSVSFPNEKTGLQRVGILQDFLIGVGISVYLIYIIPNSDLKEIIIPIVAAIYGGILTLVGVSLTIKKSDKNRKEDEMKKARPVFAFNMLNKEPTQAEFKKACFPIIDEELNNSCVIYAEIENSNLSSFTMKRIYKDFDWIELFGNVTLIPGNKCIFSYRFNSYSKMFLEIEDLLGNVHYYECIPLIIPMAGTDIPSKDSSGRVFHTLKSMIEISKQDMDDSINKENKNGK